MFTSPGLMILSSSEREPWMVLRLASWIFLSLKSSFLLVCLPISTVCVSVSYPIRFASTLYVPGRNRSLADSNLPCASTVTACEACSTAGVVLIMLTTVPCALSFATGCRPASTSWTVPWILVAQPGNDAISTSAAIAYQLRFLMPVSSPCEGGSAGIRLRSLLHFRREAGTGPSTALRTGRGCLTDDRRAWPRTPERHSFGPRWHGESRTGTDREELDWTGAL